MVKFTEKNEDKPTNKTLPNATVSWNTFQIFTAQKKTIRSQTAEHSHVHIHTSVQFSETFMHKKALGYKNDFLRNILVNFLLKYVKWCSVSITYHCVALLFVIKMLKWLCECECGCVHVWMSFLLPFSVVVVFILFLLCFVLFCSVLFGMWFCTNGKPFIVTFTYHFENEVKVKAKVKAYGSLRKTSYLLGTKFNIHLFIFHVRCAHSPWAKNDSLLQYNFIYFIYLWNADTEREKAHYGFLFLFSFSIFIFWLAYIHDKHTKCIVI